ncbi:hypothetical protein GcM1_241013, partial [Golovinomyces cichoracearum]
QIEERKYLATIRAEETEEEAKAATVNKEIRDVTNTQITESVLEIDECQASPVEASTGDATRL